MATPLTNQPLIVDSSIAPGCAPEGNDDSVHYPDSDDQPMSDNTRQFRWITTIKLNLDLIFTDNPNVFVAGDLLWYPIQGDNKTRHAPDVMVAFDRPKGDRGSYKQWLEGNIAPQVVFEILSPGNTTKEMAAKLAWYDRYGVDEYYLYDPDDNQLQGWLRSANGLQAIPQMQNWVSPRLGITFDPAATPELQIYAPTGQPFTTFEEQGQALQEKDRVIQKMADALRAMGIDPNEI